MNDVEMVKVAPPEPRVIIGIPTYNNYEFLAQEMLPSIFRGTVLPDFIFIWDNSPGAVVSDYFNVPDNRTAIVNAAKEVQREQGKKTHFAIHGEGNNVALSHAWNAMIGSCDNADHIIIANDDIRFFPDTLEKLVAGDKEFVYPAGARAGNSFSLFKINRAMWLDVGPFDANFFPAYFEDNDFHYRMKLKGYDIWPLVDCEYDHVGSATVNRINNPEEVEARHNYFRLNDMYYRYKWGGKPGAEIYTEAFNGVPRAEAIERFTARFKR